MQRLSIDELNHKEELAKRLFMSQGITFTVYSSGEGIEKIFPSILFPVSSQPANGNISKKELNKGLRP